MTPLHPLPAALVLAGSIVAGALISGVLADETPTDSDAGARANERAALVAEASEERARELFRAWEDEHPEVARKAEEDLLGMLALHEERVADFESVLAQTRDAVDLTERVLANPSNRAERDVRHLATRILRDPLALGRAKLDALEDETRADGVRDVARAAREGDAEALALLARLLDDPAARVADTARRELVALARRAQGDETLLAAMNGAGIDAHLAAMLTGADDRDRRQILRALGDLKSPLAIDGWMSAYAAEESRRAKTEAARELKELGRVGPYQDMIGAARADLGSGDRAARREGIQTLTALGGDDARAVLENALAADPDGEDARSIQRALRMLDRRQDAIAPDDGEGRLRFGGERPGPPRRAAR